MQKSNEQLQRSYKIKNEILKVQSYLTEAENTQRGYLISEDKSLLTVLSKTQKKIYAEIDSLRKLVDDDASQRKIIAALKETVSLRYRILYQTTDAENSSNLTVFLKNAEKGKEVMDTFLALSNKMYEVETNLLDERKNESDWLEFVTSFYLKLLLVVSILFQVISFLIIIKAYKRRKVYQRVLENKIKELNLSYSEMEQIAFVASHDLQEPLRKIRTYSDKLKKNFSLELSKEGEKLLDKVASASHRMQELLNDFINYTMLVKNTEVAQAVQLEKVIDDVQKEFKNTIEAKRGILKVDPLPAITGYHYQLNLLFENLLDNALKFSKPSVPLEIEIKVSHTTIPGNSDNRRYIKISFSDNGIGFEKEFAEKIFIIFQRLHSQNSSYSGKGIGLAICKRVMVNHGGYITASGEAGIGATFNLFFPEPV